MRINEKFPQIKKNVLTYNALYRIMQLQDNKRALSNQTKNTIKKKRRKEQ